MGTTGKGSKKSREASPEARWRKTGFKQGCQKTWTAPRQAVIRDWWPILAGLFNSRSGRWPHPGVTGPI